MASRRAFLGLLGGGIVAAGGVVVGMSLRGTPPQVSAYPTIRYGEEMCTYCGMSIDDARFASAWRASGPERHFDDIGCMVSASHRDQPAGDVQFYVHDYQTEAWLDATAATFVVSRSIKTPMAYGVAAVARPEEVQAFAQQGVTAYMWVELAQAVGRKG